MKSARSAYSISVSSYQFRSKHVQRTLTIAGHSVSPHHDINGQRVASAERFDLHCPIDQQPQDRHAVTLKLGALTGVPTPFTDVLLGLARLQARVRGLY